MWGIAEDKVDEKVTFLSPNILPNWTCCMSSCNRVWIFSRTFGFDWWCLFNNEYFQGVKYMSNNWHFLMVGSCVTTMNIKNVGSCVNNIHFMMWNAWVTAGIFLMVSSSCVTTMNVKNFGSCVNNIHFIICFLAAQ